MKKTYIALQLAPMTNGMKTWVTAYDVNNGLYIHKSESKRTWVISHHSGLAIKHCYSMPLHYAQRYAERLGKKVDMTKNKEEITSNMATVIQYREAIRQTSLEISLYPECDIF